jgi:hypothetical protein
VIKFVQSIPIFVVISFHLMWMLFLSSFISNTHFMH